MQIEWGVHTKHVEQCVSHSKHSTNVSNDDDDKFLQAKFYVKALMFIINLLTEWCINLNSINKHQSVFAFKQHLAEILEELPHETKSFQLMISMITFYHEIPFPCLIPTLYKHNKSYEDKFESTWNTRKCLLVFR